MRKAILTKPLDGKPEGSEAEFSNTDFDMLEKLGAVKSAPEGTEDPEAKQAPAVPENKAEPAPVNKSRAGKKPD
jgi:hypothetical protein